MTTKQWRFIPFWMLPQSWGMSGARYDEAYARYYYTGRELQRRLIDISCADDIDMRTRKTLALQLEHREITEYEHDMHLMRWLGHGVDSRARWEIELKHGNISELEFDTKVAELEHPQIGKARSHALLAVKVKHAKLDAYDAAVEAATIDHPDPESKEQKLALLKIDHEHGKIEGKPYEKALATINDEPWIGIINDGFDLNQGLNGVYFEFDWNDHWIKYLQIAGYYGDTEEVIVEQWFNDVCRNTAMQVQEDEVMEVLHRPFGGRK